MIIPQPEAMIFAWWLRAKVQAFTVDAEMTAFLRRIIEALETGETIIIQGGAGESQGNTADTEGDRTGSKTVGSASVDEL